MGTNVDDNQVLSLMIEGSINVNLSENSAVDGHWRFIMLTLSRRV